jgi:serine/threonine-protein kinase
MTAASLPQDLRIGSVLDGRYRILDRISTGGMGVVYRAERLHLNRPVAIKFLLAPLTHEPSQRASFEREAQLMSQLSHPHCVPVTDFGVSDAPYLVMEYVAGHTLKQVLMGERMAPARAVRLTRQLLSGLAHAHAQGIVHRDIKPANIMLTDATGVGEQVRVLDFGLAKLHAKGARLTSEAELEAADNSASNLVVGTPQYMAPEQWQQGAPDPRTDLYATGVVLFEMLTGRRPFEARAPIDLLRAHMETPAPPLASVNPYLSGFSALEAVVQKALEKSPDARFASAEEFAQALEALTKLPEEAGNPGADLSVESEALETTWAAARSIAAPRSSIAPEARAARAPTQTVRSRRPWLWLSLPVAACLWLGSTLLLRSPSGSASRVHAAQAKTEVLTSARAQPAPMPELKKAPEPAEPAVDPALPQPALTLEEQLEQEQYDAVLVALEPLRKSAPQDARLLYLEGRALYGKGHWREAYARYRDAIERDWGYRTDRHIAAHLIRGLGSSSAIVMARDILKNDLRGDALRPLARAARQDHRSQVRARAAALHDEIQAAL